MASHARNPSATSGFPSYGGGRSASAQGDREKTYFEQQREALIMDIANSFEHVLQSVNRVNRGLEATIAVGNEFSSVEALWSQFENVMQQGHEQSQEQEEEQGHDERAETEEVEERGEGHGDGEERERR